MTKIKGDIVEFYQNLYTSSNLASTDICTLIELRITATMAESFTILVSRDEVKKTVFQLGALKAPGPEGMSGIFYQHCWDIVGKDLADATLFFFVNGRMDKKMNHTRLTLTPKVPHPKSI